MATRHRSARVTVTAQSIAKMKNPPEKGIEKKRQVKKRTGLKNISKLGYGGMGHFLILAEKDSCMYVCMYVMYVC